MPDPLSQDVWFLIWRKRYWSIRRKGDILIAKLAMMTMGVAIVGFLLAGFIHWIVGLLFGIAGIGWSQWWFSRIRKLHTNATMTLEEWKRRRAEE